ncbi:MAG: glycosyltransferase family 39 protein [Acidobacteriota bacterium]
MRFLSAAAGTLSCLTAIALGRALLPRGGGTLAGLALAGLRWSVTLSRWGYVAIVLVPLADAAMLALLHARRRRSAAAAAAAGAILGIGAHIYLASWIVLAALLLFVLWPIEGGAAVAKRVILALALACGFALVAAPLFLFREGRQAPYFARASNQSMLRSLRSARSPLPVMASAADAIAAP